MLLSSSQDQGTWMRLESGAHDMSPDQRLCPALWSRGAGSESPMSMSTKELPSGDDLTTRNGDFMVV